MKTDIILSGVGGQGILSIAAIIGEAALAENLYIKQAEVHGMSQRGGDVQSIQEGMLADGLSRCILAIGICDRAGASVNAFSFVCTGEGVKMNLVPWNVVQGDGSVRSRYDAAYRDSVIMPQVKEAVYHELNMIPVQQMPPENGVTFDTGFWLNNKENRLQLKRIVSYIQSKYSDVKLLKVDDMTIEIRFDIPRRSSWRIVWRQRLNRSRCWLRINGQHR